MFPRACSWNNGKLAILKGMSHQILWPFFGLHGIGKEPLLVLKFSVTPSIFGGHFKVFMHLIPKHLWHSRNLWDGFTNVVSVLRDLLFPFQRTAGKVKILQGDESTTHTNLEKMFSHLLGVLREKYGPTTTFLNLEVHLVDSWILQLNVKWLNDKWLNN